jgi:putative colanic acid biosysnthesis UDP-glucose lipid carrier transferase
MPRRERKTDPPALSTICANTDASLHATLVPQALNFGSQVQARRRSYRNIKRLIDISMSLLAILVCSPLLALIVLLVQLDSPGPILFRQRRVGLEGRTFAILKFRTLTVLEDGPQIVQVHQNDLRMTRVGRWLRPLFLDELPQLLNVLRGDMSLVGPRPHAVAHDGYYSMQIAGYAGRHAVVPGLTGWAQVNGAHGATPSLSAMRKRVELDLWYIAHANIALDLLILARTPLEILRRAT